MKKIVSIFFILTFAFLSLTITSCGKNNQGGTDNNTNGDMNGMTNMKLGIGTHSESSEKNADGAKNGALDVTYTVAASIFDKDGKILKCKLDTIESHANFSSEGKGIAPSDFKSKQELGDSYVMTEDESKLKWYEQADAFAKKCEGKKIEDVKKLVADGGKGTDEIMKAGCTISVSEFVLAVENSFKNTKDFTAASVGDLSLSLNVDANISDAKESASGKAELKGKFSAEVKNANQSVAKNEKNESKDVMFDTAGKIVKNK